MIREEYKEDIKDVYTKKMTWYINNKIRIHCWHV